MRLGDALIDVMNVTLCKSVNTFVIIMTESQSLPTFKLQSRVHVQTNMQMPNSDVLLSANGCFCMSFPKAFSHNLLLSFLLDALIHIHCFTRSILIHPTLSMQINRSSERKLSNVSDMCILRKHKMNPTDIKNTASYCQ